MIILYQSLYRDPNAARQAELDRVAVANASNPLIERIVRLNDDGIKRHQFAEFLLKINEESGPEDLNIIANSDIYFDDSLEYAKEMKEKECYALSRWDWEADGIARLSVRGDSQDAWMFRGKVPADLITAVAAVPNLGPGTPGCDNRFAFEISRAGYAVLNPSRLIRAIHLHQSGVRHYSRDEKDLVPKPYLLIEPHALGEEPNYRRIY